MNKRIAVSALLLLVFCMLYIATGCRPRESEQALPTQETAAAPSPARTLPPPAVAAAATARPTVAPQASPTPLSTATQAPPETPPTAAPTESPPTVAPTATVVLPTPTSEPTPAPTATAEPLYPEWLGYVNRFRDMGGLPPLSEQAALTLGSKLHSQYMVVNDAAISHKQDPALPLYDPAGDQAARNGNVFATSMVEADYSWGVNFWVSAPFHLVPMMAPKLERIGYGDYVEPGGDVSMAAVMDVRSERDTGTWPVTYPLFFPRDGSTTWIGRHNLYEWPDALTSCPGYSRPTGSPILVQLGDGKLTPNIGGHVLLMGDKPVETCLFDESTYHNPDSWAEKAGRQILNNQDAVVILPRHPLIADQMYTVQLEANGQRYQWSFRTAAARPVE